MKHKHEGFSSVDILNTSTTTNKPRGNFTVHLVAGKVE